MKLPLLTTVVLLCVAGTSRAESSVGVYRFSVGVGSTITVDKKVLPACKGEPLAPHNKLELYYSGDQAIVDEKTWKVVSRSGDSVVVRDEHPKFILEIVFRRDGSQGAGGSLRYYGLGKRGKFECGDARRIAGYYSAS